MHKFLTALSLLFVLVTSSFSAVQTPVKKKRTKAVSTAKKPTVARAKTVRTPPRSAASRSSSKTIAKKTVARKTVARGRRPAAPTRTVLQGQPTQDRYREIQQALVEKGYYKGEPGGQWNAESVDALKRFQTDQNLTSDGKLNSLSLIALGLGPKRTLNAQNTPRPPVAQPAPSIQPSQPIQPGSHL